MARLPEQAAVAACEGEHPSHALAGRALWAGILVLVAVYVVLFVSGVRFFVLKTAVLPLFLIYALTLRQRSAFVIDWVPLLAATLLFDAVRGVIWTTIQHGYQTYYVEYVIALERALFGVPAAPLVVQTLRTPGLDMAAVAVHASHFAFFLLFGLVCWHLRRDCFPLFRRSLMLVMAIGLIGYAAVPTAPPWMASAGGLIPNLTHVAASVYTFALPDLYRAFDTNPVAAMPSLHVAFPAMCALVGWRAYGGTTGWLLGGYAMIVALVSVYLGEHYAVDALAGVLVAALAVWLAGAIESTNWSARARLATSAVAIVLTVALALVPSPPSAPSERKWVPLEGE